MEMMDEVERQMNQNNVPQNNTSNSTPRFTMEMIDAVEAQMNQAQNGVGVQSAPVSSVPTLKKPMETKAKETKVEETKKIDLAERQKKKNDFQQRRIDKMSDGPVKQKDKKTGADIIGYTNDGKPIYDMTKITTESLSQGGKATNINDSNASKLLSKDEYKNRKKKQASLNKDSEWASNHPVLATAEKVGSAPIDVLAKTVGAAYDLANGEIGRDKVGEYRKNMATGVKSNFNTKAGEMTYDATTKLAETALDYFVLNNLIPSGAATEIPFLGQAIGSDLSRKALLGLAPDMIADVIPNAIDNYRNGMRGKELATETIKNAGTDYAMNLGIGGVFDYLGMKPLNPLANTVPEEDLLAREWLKLGDNAVEDTITPSTIQDQFKQAKIAQIKGKYPLTYGQLEDEDIWKMFTESGVDEAQNYSTMYNIMNNTDTVPVLKKDISASADDMVKSAGLGDYVANEGSNADVVAKFRQNNPALSESLSDNDIVQYISNNRKLGIGNDFENTISTPSRKSIEKISNERKSINDQINRYKWGQMASNEVIHLGDTPDIYIKLGAEQRPVTMPQSAIDKIAYPVGYEEALKGGAYKRAIEQNPKKSLKRTHDLGYEVFDLFPEQFDNPVAVMKSRTQKNSFIALTEMVDKNGNGVIIPVHLNKNNSIEIANVIPSIYGREELEKFIKKAIDNNELLYLDKNRDVSQLALNGLDLSKRVADNDPIFKESLQQAEDIVNTHSASTSNKVMLDDTGIGRSRELPNDSYTLTYDPGTNVYLEEGEKVSKFRTNTLVRNENTTEDILRDAMPQQNYVYKMKPHEVTEGIARGNVSTKEGTEYFLNKFLNENYKPEAAEESATIKNLYNNLLEEYNETGNDELLKQATELSKVAQIRFTDWGQGVESAKLWSDTPAGILNTANKDVRASVDSKYGNGFSDRLDDITGKITDIFNDSSKDEATKIEEITKLFKDKGNVTNKKIKGEKEIINRLKEGQNVNVSEISDILSEVNKIPHLSEEVQKNILKLAETMQGKNPDSAESRDIIRQINRELSKNANFSLKDKAVELSHIMMLTGVPTHERNLLANVAMLPNEKIAAKLSAVGQYGYKLFNPDYNPTQSLVVLPRYKKLAKQVYENIGGSEAIEAGVEGKYTNAMKGKLGADEMFLLNTGSEGNKLTNAIGGTLAKAKGALGMDVNKNTISQIPVLKQASSLSKKGLDTLSRRVGAEGAFDGLSAYKSNTENFRQFIYGLLEMGDKPFVKKNFTDRLSSYLSAQGIKDIENIPQEAIDIARSEALKATFKDDNGVVDFFKAVKRIPVVGELTLPYTKTPANVTARSIDFSPLSLVNIMKRYVGDGKIEKGTVSDMFDDIGKMVGGTSLAAVGAYLAANGVLQGAYSEDARVKAYEKSIGIKEYSLSTKGLADFLNDKLGTDFDFGDRYETISWMQPAISSMMAGMAVYDAVNNGDDLNALDISKKASGAYVNSIMQNSTLNNVLELTDSTYGQTPVDNAFEDLVQMPLRFIPADLNSTAKVLDTTQRSTYVKGDPLATAINLGKSRIPELSKELPARHDVWGRTVVNQPNTKSAIINNKFNPGQLSNDTSVPFGEELENIADKTGSGVVYPQIADWNVTDANGNAIKLDNVNREELQEKQGTYSLDWMTDYFNSDTFKNINEKIEKADSGKQSQYYEEEKSFISRLHNAAAAKAKNELFGTPISDEHQKLIDSIEDGTVFKNFEETFEKKRTIEEMESKGLKTTDTAVELYQSGNKKEAEIYSTITSISTGVDKNGDAKYLDYNDKTREIFNRKGEEGLKTYASLYQAATNTPSGSASGKSAFNAVNSKNMTAADKGFYLANIRPNLGKLPQSFADNGNYADVYYYYEVMNELDGTNGGKLDGQLSKAEKTKLIPTLKKFGLSNRQSEVESWYK